MWNEKKPITDTGVGVEIVIYRGAHKKLRYQGFDQFGNSIERTVNGFHARVVQYECDHLQGVLYPMRVKDMRQFGFADLLPFSQT